MGKVPHTPPEPTPQQKAQVELELLHSTLTGEIRDAAAAAGLHVAERRRRLELLLFALPIDTYHVTIGHLLDVGPRGSFDPAVEAAALDAAQRQIAAIGLLWRLAQPGLPVDPDARRCPTCGEDLDLIAAGRLGHIPGDACARAQTGGPDTGREARP